MVVVGVILDIIRVVGVMKGSCRDRTRPGIQYMIQRGEGARVPDKIQVMHYLIGIYKQSATYCVTTDLQACLISL